MIPKSFILEWINVTPWAEPRQVEQDLIITKALLELYSHPELSKTLAFRGGTALNKLYFNPPYRYSEDIDLVQVSPQPIGTTIGQIREVMHWLGEPKRDSSRDLVTLSYRTRSDDDFPIKLKLEINTREHDSLLGLHSMPFVSSSSWCPGNVSILTYKIEELLGTKMRALYQRRKGRDLYDLFMAMTGIPNINADNIINCFNAYTAYLPKPITKQLFVMNMEDKLSNPEFRKDILPLLPHQQTPFDPEEAYKLVRAMLIEKLQ